MKKKATPIILLLLLAAGLAVYFAYLGRAPAERETTTGTSASSPELWTTAGTGASTETPGTEKPNIPTTAAATTPTTARTTTAPPRTQPPDSAYAFAGVYEGINPAITVNATGNPYLILVNRHYALPRDYQPALAVCVPTYPEKKEMEQTAAAQYKLMYDAALKEGAELIPYSGYRSMTHQKSNFDRKIDSLVGQGMSRTQAVNMAAMSIMPPRCSEHEAGLAMDITRPGYWDTRDDFKDTKEYAWLTAHAHEYGFILRYPKDKTEITLVQFEPWHWRYVGAEDATAMKASGQCLEEYLGMN